jgi:phospholipid/cholesterol/gamma-HCH transport system substrate-binding protein
VGQVVDVRLAPERDGTVLVRLEVQGGVPVRTDSEATIEMMGVTGVSYVGISAGSPTAPLLTVDFGIPEIPAGRSVLQTLTEDAPEILAETLNLLDQLTRLFDATNQQKVQNILDNLERSSEELSQALVDFAGVSQTVGQATADIAYFTTILEPVIEGAEATLARVDTALETYTALGTRAVEVLEDGDEVLAAGRRAFDAADLLLSGELPVLMRELTGASEAARGQVERLGPQAEALIAGFAQTGTLANDRLAELAGTIAATDAALAGLGDVLDTVERAAAGVEGLVTAETTQATLAGWTPRSTHRAGAHDCWPTRWHSGGAGGGRAPVLMRERPRRVLARGARGWPAGRR